MKNEKKVINVNIDDIIPNRFQPRLVFDEKLLSELAESIKEHGIIQPLIVRPLNNKYEIIAGERRYKAATLAGLTEVPVIVSQLSDYKSAEVAIIENIQRKNLNPVEEAKSYKRILDNHEKTQQELAKELGVNQSTIANKLRLLSLPNEIQEALSLEKISERHARSLLKINSFDKQIEFLNKTISERLTVRQLDDIIKDNNNVFVKESNVLLNEYPPSVLTPEETNDTSENNIPLEEPEKIESIETIELTDNKSTGLKSFFEHSEEKVSYPSLDDLITNMDLGIEDEIFNPFKNEEEPVEEEITEEKVEIPEAIIIPEKVEPEKIIEPNNIDSIKTALINLKQEISEAGYKINFEDFDFSDLYQVIIKIEKEN